MTDDNNHFTYAQKQELLKFLSTPQNWQNRFNEDFLSNELRLAKVMYTNGYAVALTKSKDKGWVSKHGIKSRLFFERGQNELTITDESGQSIVLHKNTAKAPIGEEHAPEGWRKEISIPAFGLDICIQEDGTKLIYDQTNERYLHLDAPAPDHVNEITAITQRFHVVSIDELTSMQRFELGLTHLIANVKLVLGLELGLQPSMRGVNTLSPLSKGHTIYVEDGDESAKAIIDAHEKKWSDSTQFSGHRLDLATQFSLQRTDRGIDIRTHHDHKTRILNQGHLIRQALERKQEPIVLSELAKDPFHDGINLRAALYLANSGITSEDTLSRPWRYVMLETPHAPALASLLRELFRDQIGIDDDHYCALNIDTHKCLLAIHYIL